MMVETTITKTMACVWSEGTSSHDDWTLVCWKLVSLGLLRNKCDMEYWRGYSWTCCSYVGRFLGTEGLFRLLVNSILFLEAKTTLWKGPFFNYIFKCTKCEATLYIVEKLFQEVWWNWWPWCECARYLWKFFWRTIDQISGTQHTSVTKKKTQNTKY